MKFFYHSFTVMLIAMIFPIRGAADVKSSLIPLPNEMTVVEGSFLLDANTVLSAEFDLSGDQKLMVGRLTGQLRQFSGLNLSLTKSVGDQASSIRLKLNDKIAREGYQLDINKGGIVLQAATDRGLFYGWQTLLQLMTDDTNKIENKKTVAITLPCLTIKDAPRFEWRGFMLDNARHFQDTATVKCYIDRIAFYKMNVIHLHLTDDQAWRIAIDKYPKLTTIGAFPGEKGQEVNGFYSKKDIREIVAYAKERFVTVVPEIEIPGHSTAALFCYPEFSCKEGPFTRGKPGRNCFWEVNGRLAFCAGNDKTLTFLKDVLSEVMDLFEGPIHIGGDERPKGNWDKCSKCQGRMKALGLDTEDKLQNWLMTEMNKHILKRGYRSMAWEENSKDGIPEKQIVQAWHRGEDVAGVQRGHQVVNSIHNFTYLDYPINKAQKTINHATWMPLLSLTKCYSFNPIHQGLSAEHAKLVIGVESPIWTESVLRAHLDFKVFPRLLAIAEVAWTEQKNRNFSQFVQRLKNHCSIMQMLGIKYDETVPELK